MNDCVQVEAMACLRRSRLVWLALIVWRRWASITRRLRVAKRKHANRQLSRAFLVLWLVAHTGAA